MWDSSMFISLKALRKMTFVDEPLSTRILLILQLDMSKEMTRASWLGLIRVESSLLMNDSTRLEVALGRVGEALVSGFTVARACRLAAE